MRLSVCMIVRNEEARLRESIESVRNIADEVIVCDTGSTDGTVALAESLGALVNRFTWCEDFAAARNACAVHARGEWILWLDADEKLKVGGDEILRRELADPMTIAYQLIREDFYSSTRENWCTEMYQLRLVRRALPVKFVGRIHEHLEPWPVDVAKRLGKRVGISDAHLQHWGYTNDRLPEKYARAAVMCEMELKERPGQLYYLVEWARALLALNTPESCAKGEQVLAAAVANMMVHRKAQSAPSPLAASLLEQLLAMPGQTLVAEAEVMELSRRWFPKNPPLVWGIARTLCMRGEWQNAERELRRLIEMLRTRSYDRYGSFDPRVEEDAKFNLGVCLVRLARLDEAEGIFKLFVENERRSAEATTNLAVIADLRAKFGVGGG